MDELRLASDGESNRKAFFRYLGSISQRKEIVAQLLSGDGKMATGDKEKAEVLNSYFTASLKDSL